ncbi:MAG: hypothetical protein ACREH5_07835, partial [Candidatus Omnitrophota bacterium]
AKKNSRSSSDFITARMQDLSKPRFVAVCALIIFLAGGSLLSILLKKEWWPFSPYAMYSKVKPAMFKTVKIIGLGESREWDLTNAKYWHPYNDESRFIATFRRLWNEPGAEARLDPIMAFMLRRYEERRLAGKHDGPRLLGVRFEKVGYDAKEVLAGREEPVLRRALYEYRK